MPVSRVILVEVFVQVPEGEVIGVVFFPAVEAFLVGTAVRFAQVAVELPVLGVIAVIVVSQRRGSGATNHSAAAAIRALFAIMD